jgi:cytoskeleton protein RodZ
METLGQFLKREREFRGVSLERLAGMTRINSSVLKRLEEDDFGRSTQAIYVKSFLKSYAGHLGLDAGEVMKRYEGQAGESEPDEAPPAPRPLEVEKLGLPPILWIAVSLLASVLIAVAFYLRRH